MQYLLTLLSQACCHLETYKTQYPNHLLSFPHSDIHLLAAAKYTDFLLSLWPSLLRSQSTTLGPVPKNGTVCHPPLNMEHHLSSDQLQDQSLHWLFWAAHWSLSHWWDPDQIIKCSQDFSHIFFPEDDKTRLQKVFVKKPKKRRLNNERNPKSTLIGNKKWFSATNASLSF